MTTKILTSHELAKILLSNPDIPVYNEHSETDRDGDYYFVTSTCSNVQVTPDGVFIDLERMDYRDGDKIKSPSKKPIIDTIRIKMHESESHSIRYFPLEGSTTNFFTEMLSHGKYYGWDGNFSGVTLWGILEPIDLSEGGEHVYISDIECIEVTVGFDAEWNPILQIMNFEEAMQYIINKYNLKIEEDY